MKKEKTIRGKPFMFGIDSAKKARRRVTEQEEDGARLIGGRRHVGSGAIAGLKSDASSEDWQQESKQTAGRSIGLKLEWLNKIYVEARQQNKKPMMHLRFTNIPEYMTVYQDWVVIPADIFGKLIGKC